MVVVLIFLAVDATVFDERMEKVRAGRGPVLIALDVFAKGTRKYFGVATIFGGIVAVHRRRRTADPGHSGGRALGAVGLRHQLHPEYRLHHRTDSAGHPRVAGRRAGLAIAVIVVYCVVNFIIQSVLQPKFVGDAVGLTTTVSFLSLIVWAYILGPIGAILAIPASLLFKALLVDMDPDAQWLELFLGDKPVFKDKKAAATKAERRRCDRRRAAPRRLPSDPRRRRRWSADGRNER